MKKKAFTFIELLMGVAIVAVLLAIASPNFVQAETGAESARLQADPQSMEMPEATANLSENADASSSAFSSSDGSDESYGPVGRPDKPDGPTKGKVNKKLKYETEGTDPFNVHYYMYDWGDGSELKWKKGVKQTHKYSTPGTYNIRVKERCPWWYFITKWSKSLKVKISK